MLFTRTPAVAAPPGSRPRRLAAATRAPPVPSSPVERSLPVHRRDEPAEPPQPWPHPPHPRRDSPSAACTPAAAAPPGPRPRRLVAATRAPQCPGHLWTGLCRCNGARTPQSRPSCGYIRPTPPRLPYFTFEHTWLRQRPQGPVRIAVFTRALQVPSSPVERFLPANWGVRPQSRPSHGHSRRIRFGRFSA